MTCDKTKGKIQVYYKDMKDLKDYIKECDAATPANTMGMGNPTPPGVGAPDAKGTEGLPTAKVKKEDAKKKRKRNEHLGESQVNEVMKFNKKGFLGELGVLMAKYKVRLVHDVEGSYFEDENGEMILDLTDQFMTPEKMKAIAVKTK